jgi:transcriptional regulator with XRE-family HTH domain
VGLSLRLARIVLGLSQEQAGVLIGVRRQSARLSVMGYESGRVRPKPEKIPGIEALLERAVVYAATRFGNIQAASRAPDPTDREYALKLFKHWQEYDGSRSGLRRLLPYLAPDNRPVTMRNPLPPSPSGQPRVLTADDFEKRLPEAKKR